MCISLYVQVRVHLAMVCLGFCVSLSEFMWSWVGGGLASLSFVHAILWATSFPQLRGSAGGRLGGLGPAQGETSLLERPVCAAIFSATLANTLFSIP